MRVLITGANGFVGQNLKVKLGEREDIEIVPFTREDTLEGLSELVKSVDFIFHLAGVNRPENDQEFHAGNVGVTEALCEAIKGAGRKIPVLYTSSIQAGRDNPYGLSKEGAERVLLALYAELGVPVYIFRLANIFGKWARPDYNSAVATFCHNISRDLPIQVNDESTLLTLVYIDDVIASFIEAMEGRVTDFPFVEVTTTYQIKLGELVDVLVAFRESRVNLTIEAVGVDLTRKLYATYVSYLPPERFAYEVPKHGDSRGVFVEMLKTKDSGQFSFFTAHPGITRGGHYHHSKTEKFLVIRGNARFRFRHIVSGEFYELFTTGDQPEIVETVPGWTHDITNAGDDEMIVMLWANEIFDRENPDTFACPVGTEA